MSESRWRTKGIALLCYAVAQLGLAALILWVFYLGLGYPLAPSRLPQPWPWLIDGGLLLLFGVQHSGMARTSFKQAWTHILPPALERSAYAATSGLVVAALPFLWQSVGDTVLWNLPTYLIVIPALACLGIGLLNLRFDHAGLFGLRQAWTGVSSIAEETLDLGGPYRYIRHPLMACLLLLLWTQPVLSLNLAVCNAGLTLYIGVGVLLEERDLGRRFHPDYERYRTRVPALIPWRRPLEKS